MCLGIPVKIVERKQGSKAIVEFDGVRQEIDMRLTPDAEVGEFVILHAGFSIQTVDQKEAEETHRIIRDIE